MRRASRWVLVATATALLTGLAVPAWAAPAAPGGDHRSSLVPFADAVTTLRRTAPQGGVTTAGTFPSPSQCKGTSNNPHKASSVTNAVKGFATTSCVANVPYLDVATTVWRERWWGYQQVGSRGYNTAGNWYTVGASGQYSPCENNSWRTVGNHVARDVDGEYYSGETMKYAVVAC